MSEAKFTKGEWSVKIENGDAKVYCPHGFLTSANVIKVDNSRLDGEGWIEMRDRTEPVRESAKAESNANVHLIAAAPEMYTTLECLLDRFAPYDEASIEIGKLLAKARGEHV